jgi:adenosine deaminase CECR1
VRAALRHLLLLSLAAGTLAASPDFSARYDALRAAASPKQLYTFLYALPKGGDLHSHASGSNIPEWTLAVISDPRRNGGDTYYTRIRFASSPDAIAPHVRFRTLRRSTYDLLAPEAKRDYVPVTDLNDAERAAWCNAFRLDAADEGRSEFFQVIWARQADILRNPHVRFELLAENLKAFAAEGLRYVETQFGVDGLVAVDGTPLSREEGRRLLEERLAREDVASTGLVVRFQEGILRFSPVAERLLTETYAWVSRNRDLWVGLNMAGIEENGKGYPARFLETYRQLRRTHPTLPLSIHAGEMDGPNHHIRDTLLLGASRIGHGVNLLGDPDTLLLLQQSRRVLIEINLISNRLLEYTPELSVHPFPEFLRTGIPVCLNTDDRGMWDSNLTDEYYTAVTLFNLSWGELATLGRNSLAYSFAQPELKASLLRDYEARLAAFADRYSVGTVEDALARLASVKPAAYGYARRTWGLTFP